MGGTERTVFVLGAGASLAEAMYHRPKRTKMHPPLDRTFFRQAVAHDDGEDSLLDEVVTQARELGEPDLMADDPPVRLEAHLGRLYFEMNHNPKRAGAKAYFNAVQLYASEIIRTTNWMMGKAGPMKKMVQKEIRSGREVAIVTFNIDLLAENALHCLAHSRPSAQWSLRHAYGFNAPKPRLVARPSSFDELFPYEDVPVDIPLFKMHGSVNWVFRHRDRNPPADLISGDRSFSIIANEKPPSGPLTYVDLRGKGRKTWYLSSLIVPPVYEKHNLITRHFQDVWDGASKALREASRVIFWGYSFPDADTHARHYFQGLSGTNAALKHPITVNPDPDAESALWEVLRSKSVGHYRSAGDYLADSRV